MVFVKRNIVLSMLALTSQVFGQVPLANYLNPPDIKWSVQLMDTGSGGDPLIGSGNAVTVSPENNLVYVTLDDGRLEVLSAFDGSRRWGYTPEPVDPNWRIECSSGVYFGEYADGEKYAIYAVVDVPPLSALEDSQSRIIAVSHPKNELLWISDTIPGAIQGTPVISQSLQHPGEYIYFTHNQQPDVLVESFVGSFSVVEASTDGTLLFTEMAGENPNDPVVTGVDSVVAPYGPVGVAHTPEGGRYAGGESNPNDLMVWATSIDEGSAGYGYTRAFQLPVGFQSSDAASLVTYFLREVRWNVIAEPVLSGDGLSLYFGTARSLIRGWNGRNDYDANANLSADLEANAEVARAPIPVAPALSTVEDTLFVGAASPIFYAINVATGLPKWQMATETILAAQPHGTPDDYIVIAAQTGGVVTSYLQSNGNPEWSLNCDAFDAVNGDSVTCTNQILGGGSLSPNGFVYYFGDSQGNVKALQVATSLEPTEAPTPFPTSAPTPAPTDLPSATPYPTEAPTPCPTEAPTDLPLTTLSPSSASSFGPNPQDCFDDLDEVYKLENDADLTVVRTYILCPNREYRISLPTPGSQITLGFQPLLLRKNAHYQCGANGNSSNKCVFVSGQFQVGSIDAIADDNDPPHTNVVVRGMTFTNAFFSAIFIQYPGDVKFVDCIISDHQNFGPVLVLSNNPTKRRLESSESGDQDYYYLFKYYEQFQLDHLNNNRDDVAHGLTSGKQTSRFLDDEVSPMTSTLEFIDCIFENNIGLPLSNDVRPGIITVESKDTIIKIDNCIFRNNDYTNTLGYAIQTQGPLEIKDSCFIDNKFLDFAPVSSLLDDSTFTLSNNYISADPNNEFGCSFHGYYATQIDLIRGVATCADAMASTCQSTLLSATISTSSPTVAPFEPTAPLVPTVSAGDNNGSSEPISMDETGGITIVLIVIIVVVVVLAIIIVGLCFLWYGMHRHSSSDNKQNNNDNPQNENDNAVEQNNNDDEAPMAEAVVIAEEPENNTTLPGSFGFTNVEGSKLEAIPPPMDEVK